MKTMRPSSAPPQGPSTDERVPQLWRRAAEMFGVLMQLAGSVCRIAAMQGRARRPRREILARLEPVEKLVRGLLIIEAVTWLLMTPAGHKLMRETPKSAPPGQRTPPASTPTMAGQAPNAAAQAGASTSPAHNLLHAGSETWSCHFTCLKWRSAEPEQEAEENRDYQPPPASMPSRDIWAGVVRPRIILLDERAGPFAALSAGLSAAASAAPPLGGPAIFAGQPLISPEAGSPAGGRREPRRSQPGRSGAMGCAPCTPRRSPAPRHREP